MITFYYHHTPNPMKVALFLEEAGSTSSKATNTAIGTAPSTRTARHLRQKSMASGCSILTRSCCSWRNAKANSWAHRKTRQSFIPGSCGLRRVLAPIPANGWVADGGEYAKRRYKFEAHRHYEVLDAHLAGREFIVGSDYTIADIAAWGWVDRNVRVLGEGEIDKYPNVKAWFEKVNARPAVERARNVGKELEFKSDFDAETAQAMFPSNFAAG